MISTLVGLASDLVTVISGIACIVVAYKQLKPKKGPKNERSEDDDEGEGG